jgi:uncharacterized membrane protein
VNSLNSNTEEKTYPYSKNRVFLSTTIAALSAALALPLLLFDAILIIYYLLATFVVTILTFYLKKRLYNFLLTGKEGENRDDDTKRARWKTLLITLLMLIGSIGGPLLLAVFLSGATWFIVISSYLTGVSISEIVIYIQATRSSS